MSVIKMKDKDCISGSQSRRAFNGKLASRNIAPGRFLGFRRERNLVFGVRTYKVLPEKTGLQD